MIVTETAEYAGVATRQTVVETDGTGPTLLFLHGYSDSADTWQRVQRRLGELGHRSIAVDQPSHGRAALVDHGRAVLPQFVEFAAAAARAADRGDGVVVVGNSLGGAHALLVAQHHPELVRAVVAISPAGFDHPRYFRMLDEDSRLGNAVRRRAVPPDVRAVPDAKDVTGDDPGPTGSRPNRAQVMVRRAMVETGFRAVAFGRPWLAPAGFVADWRRQFQDPARRRSLRQLTAQIRDEYINAEPFELASIAAPVLALWGSRDRLVLVTSRSTLEAGLPDLEFVELPGVGHMPQLEVPGRTTKHIDEFVRRIA